MHLNRVLFVKLHKLTFILGFIDSTGRGGRQLQNAFEPPILVSFVASALCPSALREHALE